MLSAGWHLLFPECHLWSFIEPVTVGILVLLLFRAGQVQECECAGYSLTWYQCQSLRFEFQFRRAALGDTSNVDVFLRWTMLWLSDCPVFNHCQDSQSGLFCPFVAYDTHAEGCAQQSAVRGVTVLSSKSPGAAKFNQDAGSWSSFWSSTGTEIHVSFPSGNA